MMVKTNRLYILHGCMFLFLMVCLGCKPSVPSEYIQPGDMEDLLYDYHLADAMAMNQASGLDMSYYRMLYREAVLKKYGITQAELDSSLAYYYRNTERLKDIYARLSKRFSEEAVALGASANDINLYSSEGIKGDTANVWVSGRTTILLPQAPDNLISFAVPADTAYHAGYKMMLNFDAQYVIQDGSRDAVAMLAIRFGNDSVAKQLMHIASNTHYSLQLTDKERLGIKEVRGFVALPPMVNNKSTMKVLCLYQLKLVRMHEIAKPEDTDSIKQAAQEPSRLPRQKEKDDSVSADSPARVDSAAKAVKNVPPRPIGQPNTNKK